jgi:hypothetical protein
MDSIQRSDTEEGVLKHDLWTTRGETLVSKNEKESERQLWLIPWETSRLYFYPRFEFERFCSGEDRQSPC